MSDEKIIGNATSVPTAVEKYNDLFSQGDLLYWNCAYEKAKEHFQTVLNQPSISLLDSARCYNSLGAANAKLQNYEEALNSYHKQLDILLKLETAENKESNIAKCYMSIGKIYWLKQDYVGAIDYYKQALGVLPTIAPDPDLTSNIYKDLANLYTKTQDFDSAIMLFKKVLEIDRHQLGEDHPKFGQTYANMGAMYYSQQDYERALGYFKKAHETWQKSLTPSHIYVESMEKTIRTVQSKLSQASITPRRSPELKRIRAELTSLQTKPEPGCSIELHHPNNLYRWKLILDGPVGTPYENGRFQFTVSFPPEYPFKPPQVLLNTKIFHPNISSKGTICEEILIGGGWSPARTVRTMLNNIQTLLANANFDDFISPEAAFLFKEDRDKFHKKAVEWTQMYASEGAPSVLSEASSHLTSPEPTSAPEKTASRPEQVRMLEAATTEQVVWLSMNMSLGKNQWQWFWDVEIAILDKAYLNKEKSAELDHCIVDFDQGWQLNKKDGSRAVVIRSSNREYKAQIREKWNAKQQAVESAAFYSDTFSEQTPIISKCLTLDASVPVVANGIRYEGKMIGKPIEANYIANELEQAASNDNSLIGLQCIHQYTRSSFLNISLNKFLYNEDLSKVDILGPYLKLLFLHFKEYPIHLDEMVVYRGVNLTSEDIYAYQQAEGKGIFRWFGFTSTSKSRKVAEFYDANTLMIIRLNKRHPNDGRAVDIGVLSQFPEEEEVLLRANVQFRVEKVEHDKEKKKHLIHIKAYV